jgi:3'(2'), 5'-bisphosphate nucleotidase
VSGQDGSARPALERTDLDVLCEIALRAGAAIMDVYAGPITAWQKADASPLTEADLRADAIIREGLERHFPGVFILSEESSSDTSIAAGTLFVVDPLDGTKEFLKRNGEFTVNIALVEAGAPVAGVVYAPALNELFAGVRGGGAERRLAAAAVPIAVAPSAAGEPVRVVASRSHGDESVARWLDALPDHTLLQVGSSLKFCRIAEGRADVYPRFGPTSQWDTAAAHAVLDAAGGLVVDLAGHSLRYGLERAILNPSFIAAATTALAARR